MILKRPEKKGGKLNNAISIKMLIFLSDFTLDI